MKNTTKKATPPTLPIFGDIIKKLQSPYDLDSRKPMTLVIG
jgi:hypothetical protein